jgi:integrase
MAKALTAATVAKIRPAAARVEVPDGACPGLNLTVHPTGRKTWALRYRRPDGRSAKLVLGTAHAEPSDAPPVVGGHLNLASARALAATLRHEIAMGRDPGADTMAEKRKQNPEGVDTYLSAARDYVAHAKQKSRRWKQTASILGFRPDGALVKGGLAERWRDKRIALIDEDEIFKVVDEARERAIPGLKARRAGQSETRARATFAALSVMFNWLKERRRIKTSPVAALKPPKAPMARDRVLTDDEIRRFWNATDAIGEPFGAVMKLLLLTGARLNEVAGMRRDEIDTHEGKDVWRIPGSRTKNKRAHAVPLPPTARQIVEDAAERTKVLDTPLIFTTTGATSISGWSKKKKQLDKLMGNPAPWRLHDLRRTAVTGMARAGADIAVIERAVNHISGSFGGIVGVYQKHKYEDEVRLALQAWERLLLSIVSGDERGNVVAMERRG